MLSATEAVVCRWIGDLWDRLSAVYAILVNKHSMPHLIFIHLAKIGVAFRDHERLFQPVMSCHMLTAHRTPSEIRMRSLQEVIPTSRTVRTCPFIGHCHHPPFTVLSPWEVDTCTSAVEVGTRTSELEAGTRRFELVADTSTSGQEAGVRVSELGADRRASQVEACRCISAEVADSRFRAVGGLDAARSCSIAVARRRCMQPAVSGYSSMTSPVV
jgi:hypothetical protein